MLETTIDLESTLQKRREDALLVDVRTPAEFAETTIPGAVNIPIFSNEERAEIGTLYKQQGKMTARRRGVELVSPRIPTIIDQVETALTTRYKHNSPAIIFCWRGGLRSHAITTFLNLAGIPARQLLNGHKGFRRKVCADFEQAHWPPIFVLRGLTGIGKTRILEELQQQNYPVIDLEGLANHRGSAFGGLGLTCQPSQKLFEARLWDRLDQLKDSHYLIVEGESRHIGRLTIPVNFHRAMQQQTSLWLTTPLQHRIRIILADYHDLPRHHADVERALLSLKERLGGKTIEQYRQLLAHHDWETLIAELMTNYYDPLYLHTRPEQRIEICYDTLEQGAEQVAAVIKQLTTTTDLVVNQDFSY